MPHETTDALSQPTLAAEAPHAPPSRWRAGWSPQVVLLAVILLLIDGLLLAANIAHLFAFAAEDSASRFSFVWWNGDFDGSYIEMFGHAQLLAAAVVLLHLAVYRRAAVYGVWALIVLALAMDDFFMIHEIIGSELVSVLDLASVAGLRPEDLGELVVWAAATVALGIPLLFTTLRSGAAVRRDSLVLLGLACLLAVFGVGVDVLHIIVEPFVPAASVVLVTLVETTGELVGMTLILITVTRISQRRSADQPLRAFG